MKHITSFMLSALFFFGLISCRNEEKQNLDISVSGKVTIQNGAGIPNVKIHVMRGKIGNYAPTTYSNYEFTTTDSNGNYKYTVRNDTYQYKICCEAPTSFTIVSASCVDVDQSIIDSHTIQNIINFTLKN